VNLWNSRLRADSRLTAPARSPMDKPGKTPCVSPHLAHRSALPQTSQRYSSNKV